MMDGFDFKIDNKITLRFGIGGGGVTPQPEPGGSGDAFAGTMSYNYAGTMFTPEILCGQMEMEE